MQEQGCKTKVGLLVLRDCDRPAVSTCMVCGRPVCKKHQVKRHHEVLCVECAAGQYGTQDAGIRDGGRVGWFTTRRHYYRRYHYYPYYYGRHRYYSDTDFRAFDEDEMEAHDAFDGADAMDERGFEADAFES